MGALDTFLGAASSAIGKPYVYGDEGPNTFDCSGLVLWAAAAAGVSVPRTSQQQQAWATPVTSPRPGDLVFWGRPAYHVAIYVGDGKVIAAPQPGDHVKLQPLWGKPSSYGRIPQLAGAQALAPVTGLVGNAGSTAAELLGGARYTVLEGLGIATGVALVGFGLWRAVKGQLTNAVKGLT